MTVSLITIILFLYAALTIGLTGLIAALVLFLVSKFFKVREDPRIDAVQALLPNANCGGCGFAGCRAMAEAIVKSNSIEGHFCPGGDMKAIAGIMGLTPEERIPQIAVLRCNGTCEHAPAKTSYDSAMTCAFANTLFAGESACAYGCLGCGDCVRACPFDSIHLDPQTGLPVIDENRCVGCGACTKACPRGILELRDRGKNNRRLYVACSNREKGAVARKNCAVACIGCGKCAKICPFDAITVQENLAYIDFTKCKTCRKCLNECPTGAIHAVNFPIKQESTAAPATTPIFAES